jgi:hypothetical protein
MIMKLKKSSIIAFIDLLQAVHAGEEVFLLRASDKIAQDVLHTYSADIAEDDEVEKEYKQHIDRLSQRFALFAKNADVDFPSLEPHDEETLEFIGGVLRIAAKRLIQDQ